MVKLQKELQGVTDAGVQLVGISYDSTEILKAFAQENKITFALLSDPASKVIDAYGVRNSEPKAGSKKDGIPHPGTFLIDSDGTIRAKLFYSVFKRHTPAELVSAAKQIK